MTRVEVSLTHIGGPTVLIEVGGWRLLTDPTFDPRRRQLQLRLGNGVAKLTGPAIAPRDLGPIDAVLLSHDHHEDNLDAAGRAMLPSAGSVITTVPGAKRLGGDARGLAPWADHPARGAGPAPDRDHRHAVPPRAAAEPPDRRRRDRLRASLGRAGAGRPVDLGRHGALRRRPRGRRSPQVDTALLHLGGVRFPISGPLHYTMTAKQAVELCGLVQPRTVIPIHYEGWKHFREGREAAEREFANAPEDVRDRIRWLPFGVATPI